MNNQETNISQEAYDYLRDKCLQACQDDDVMIIARLLGLAEYDHRARMILTMNDLEISMKKDLPKE